MSESTTSVRECFECHCTIPAGVSRCWIGPRCYCERCSSQQVLPGNALNAAKVMEVVGLHENPPGPVASDIDREARQLWLDVFSGRMDEGCSVDVSLLTADRAVSEFRQRFDPEYKADAETP